MKTVIFGAFLILIMSVNVYAQSETASINLTGEATVSGSAGSDGTHAPAECWHDPYPSEAQNTRVECTDPSCNVGPCTEKESATTDPAKECWRNPTLEIPGSFEQNTKVSCDDPTCNDGPCADTSQMCWHNPTKEDPPSRAANTRVSCGDSTCNEGPCINNDATHTPEWTSPPESDPGVSAELDITGDITIGGSDQQEVRSGYVKFGDIKGESDDSGSQAKKPKEIVVVGSKVREAVVAGVVVRGWDPEKKEATLGVSDVQSEGDLIDFSAGILASDDSISSIEISDSSIGVDTYQSVRLFGLLPAKMEMRIDVKADPDDVGRVKVRFPWWSFFAKTSATADDIKAAVETELTTSIEIDSEVFRQEFGPTQGSARSYQILGALIEASVVTSLETSVE